MDPPQEEVEMGDPLGGGETRSIGVTARPNLRILGKRLNPRSGEGLPESQRSRTIGFLAVCQEEEGPALEPEELTAFCKERLAAYKYPRIIKFSEGLPRGPTGKILKRELRLSLGPGAPGERPRR